MLQLTCPNNTELNTLPPPHYWNINEVNTASMLNVTYTRLPLPDSLWCSYTNKGGWVGTRRQLQRPERSSTGDKTLHLNHEIRSILYLNLMIQGDPKRLSQVIYFLQDQKFQKVQ